jgi:hypothetical protein
VKITNGEIFNTSEPLNKLMAAKLPIKTCYQLAKVAQLLSDHITIIGQMRDKLIKDYGTLPKEGPQRPSISPTDEAWPKFAEELGELMAQEVELEFNVVKLPLNFEIETWVIFALEKFIELDEE